MGRTSNPGRLSEALSKLISLKGLGRVRAGEQLCTVWQEVAGPRIAGDTRVLGINHGVLKIAVSNAPLLGELAAFHKFALLGSLRERYPELRITDLKFRLKGDAAQ